MCVIFTLRKRKCGKIQKRKPAEGESEAYPFNAGAARGREAAERIFCRGLKAEPCLFNAKCSREAGAVLPCAASVKGKMYNAVKHR